MKNRDYKNFSVGEIYHIYNRGVGKMNIFIDNEDHKVFLSRLEENIFPEKINVDKFSWSEKRRSFLPSNSFDLICYCLMPNHYHLIIQQLTDLPISKLLLKVCTSYAMYFNKKYKRVGTLFQDQSKAVPLENNEQLLWTSFYIHKNPLEAKLVDNVIKYRWNSYLEYVGQTNSILCNRDIILGQFSSKDAFIKHFNHSISDNYNPHLVGIQDLLIDNFE